MQSRPMRRLAKILVREHHNFSFRQLARIHQITNAAGKPNPGLVKHLIDGYQPRRAATLARIPVPPVEPRIVKEPVRRVLSGAWKLHGRWVGPEEYFNRDRQ
jgi:hypothetical protein